MTTDNNKNTSRASVVHKRGGETISTQPASQGTAQVGATTVNPNALSLTEFLAKATSMTIEIAGQKLVLEPKAFSTGSFGFFCGGKLVIEVGGKPVKCQLGLNLTVVGSKDAPR